MGQADYHLRRDMPPTIQSSAPGWIGQVDFMGTPFMSRDLLLHIWLGLTALVQLMR